MSIARAPIARFTIAREGSSVATSATVTPSQGTIVITGLAPTIAVTGNAVVEPGQGTVVITGLASTISVTGNVVAEPGIGAIEITGLAPSVIGPIVVEPGYGSVVINGYAPTCIDSGAGAGIPVGGIGRKRGRGRPGTKPRIWVEIRKGPIYEVEDEEEARRVVKTIEKQAERKARQLAKSDGPVLELPPAPDIAIHGEMLPWVVELEREIDRTNEYLAAFYVRMYEEAMRRRDDEDAITALLLT